MTYALVANEISVFAIGPRDVGWVGVCALDQVGSARILSAQPSGDDSKSIDESPVFACCSRNRLERTVSSTKITCKQWEKVAVLSPTKALLADQGVVS